MVKVQVKKEDVEKASVIALVVVNPNQQAYIIERDRYGGVNSPIVEENANIYTIDTLKSTNELSQTTTTVPYVKKDGTLIKVNTDSSTIYEVEYI